MASRRLLTMCATSLALMVLAGCGSSSSPSSSGSGRGQGGPITIASSVAPPTLDLTSNPAAAIDEVLDFNVYQHLVQLDPKGQIVPVLATSYNTSPDGLTYTFTLRKGARFANGDPVTAADVVFSLQRVNAPNSVYPYKLLLSDVTNVAAQGDSTVVVTLGKPNNQFLHSLAGSSDGVVLDPNSVSTMATSANGAGPYKLSDFQPHYSATLVPNPNYWGPPPAVSKVTFRYFSNANAEVAALKSGQVQAIDNLSNPQDAAQFKNDPAYKVITGPTNGKIQLTINNTAGPLSNLMVRQAIEYATDKKAILQAAGAGYGTVIGSDTVPGDPWYSTSYANAYPYDPAKAKQLLAQAGYPNGFSLTLTLPPYGYAQASGPLIAAELGAIGINVTVKSIDFPLWISQVFTNHDFDLTIVDHVEPRDVGNYANPKYYWDYSKSAQIKTMLDAAQSATSDSQMIAGYQQILQMVTADAVNDWLYNPDQLTVAKANLVGLPSGGLTESFDLRQVSVGGSLSSEASGQGYAS